MKYWPLILLLFVQGCANTPVSNKSARQAYQAIENNVLSSAILRVNYQVTAQGAVSADIQGDLVMQKPAQAALGANGIFAGANVAPMLIANGEKMRGGNATIHFDQSAPEGLRDGMLIGLMRMGVLHNLATLSQGVPPEGTNGDVREWVVAEGFQWQSTTRRVDNIDLRGIGFSLQVGGEPAGEVVLWYDPVTGLPVEREQVVHFSGGDMQVSERYQIKTDGMIGPCRFDINTLATESDI